MKPTHAIGVLLVAFLLTACWPPRVLTRFWADSTSSCANSDLPFPRPEPAYNAKRVRDLSHFADALAGLTAERVATLDELLTDATILDMQQALTAGSLTSTELVAYYLNRIQRYDIDKLNSVMELNPQALAIASQLDDERAAGNVRGNLHGIPVLLKDNIATGDGLHNSAGAYALRNWQPDRDAFLVQQLRSAGAIILGKANLSEWANYMDPCMPNGFSTVGGQTRNPYGPFETFGSSSGSAVAVSANLTAASVGTETQGSIMLPAAINSVVGLKTSMGLVSRDYVVPLLEWQDVPGPMGRTVTDVAVMLTAMIGVDQNDPATQDAAALAGVDFTQFLSVEAAQKLRVGIIVYSEEDIENMLAGFGLSGDKGEVAESLRNSYRSRNEAQRALGQHFSELDIEVVEVSGLTLPERVNLNDVLPFGFKDAINRFLSNVGDQVEAGSLEAIIALNSADPVNRAPYGQGYLVEAQNSSLSEKEYLALKEHNQQTTRDALSNLFANSGIDVLLSDVGQAYAPAGFPAMTVPAGYDETGQPTGLNMIANYLGEPALIAVGFAFEQATNARRAPNLETTMEQIKGLGSQSKTSAASQAEPAKPTYLTDLEIAYGAPSQAAFGSAVFAETLVDGSDLTTAALAKYKYFVGGLWGQYGEAVWMSPWKEVYIRSTDTKPDIIGELRAIEDADAALSVPMILDNLENADQARAALSATYDNPAVNEVRVFNLGDGGAMAGLLVAGRRTTGESIFLVFLLD